MGNTVNSNSKGIESKENNENKEKDVLGVNNIQMNDEEVLQSKT